MKLKEAVRSFYFHQSANGLSPGTCRGYRAILEDLSGQEMEIGGITPQTLQDHLAGFQDLSPSTMNGKKACLRSFFRWAMESGYIKLDPTRMIKLAKVPMKEARFMSLGEIKKLLKVTRANPRDHLLLSTFLNTGLRLSECASLSIGDIRGKDSLQIVGKGKKVRTIFISPDLKKLVKQSVNGASPDTPLFLSERGTRLSSGRIQEIFKVYLIRAKIDPRKFHVHSLRHTFGTFLYAKTLDLRLVQECLGHSSPAMTMRYTHVAEQDKRKGVANLYN